MLGMLVLAIHDLAALLRVADITAAMSVEALLGTDRVFAGRPHPLRPHPGQARAPPTCVRLLAGSADRRRATATTTAACRTPTPCAAPPRCTARRATPSRTRATVADVELASADRQPGGARPTAASRRNGNFHGAPLGYVLDFLAIAVADLASIAERRTDRLLDPARSHGLPPFLADEPGVDSGLMIAQYTQAALVAELKRLAAPASVDSIPTSRHAGGPRLDGLGGRAQAPPSDRRPATVLAIELVAAARALDAARAAAAARHPPRPLVAALHDRRARARPRPLPRTRARGGDRADLRDRRAGRRSIAAHVAEPSTEGAPVQGARPGRRAPRGTTLTARGWQQEAALRMLMNNLDPEVAERPDDLVVYGGTGRAARDWPSFDAIVRTLHDARGRRDDARPVRSTRSGSSAPTSGRRGC